MDDSTLLAIRASHINMVAPCMSTEGTRYYLKGIYFERHAENGVVAVTTDGHRMAIAHDPAAALVTDGDVIFSLSSDLLKALNKRDVRDFTRWLVVKRVASGMFGILTNTHQPDAVEDAVSCALEYTRFSVTEIDGTFPDWRRVLPSSGQTSEAKSNNLFCSYNMTLLASFKTAAQYRADGVSRYSAHEINTVTIVSDDPTGPAWIRVTYAGFAGIIMPVRCTLDSARPGFLDTPPPQDSKSMSAEPDVQVGTRGRRRSKADG